jgi:hypothetical protein
MLSLVLCLPTFATIISDAENVKAFAKGAAGGAGTTASHHGASHLDPCVQRIRLE